MFCTVKKNGNKYAVYLSERVRENGKVKSRDKYIFSLKAEEVENGTYEERLSFSTLTDKEQKLIICKLGNMEVTLHDTTKDKSLHTTTRVDIVGVVEHEVLEYYFFINDIFIVKFDSLDFEHARISIISKVFKDECESKSFNSNDEKLDKLYDTILDLYQYHHSIKGREDKVRQEARTYYENTILALQMKIAELQNNSGRTSLHTTTDPMKVKKIYRALASKLHPDNGGSDELMQMLNELKEMIK